MSPTRNNPNDDNNTDDNNNSRKNNMASFAPGIDWILLSQGAEGRIWKIPNYFDDHINNQNTNNHNEVDAHTTEITKDTTATNATNHNNNMIVVAKERFTKKYRHPIIDDKLTKQRCKMEGKILQKCYNAILKQPSSVIMDVPRVIHIDTRNAVLYLEYIDGITVRDCLLFVEQQIQVQQRQEQSLPNDEHSNIISNTTINTCIDTIGMAMGKVISTLHYQLGIIHGDLTTSNMMIRKEQQEQLQQQLRFSRAPSETTDSSTSEHNKDNTFENRENVLRPIITTKEEVEYKDDETDEKKHGARTLTTTDMVITMIDFGLSKNSESVEERAVDLYVLERALISTHPNLYKRLWKSFLKSYIDESNATNADNNNTTNDNNNKNVQKMATDSARINNDNNPNNNIHSRKSNANSKNGAATQKISAVQATIARFEQVRQRGRKRECFG